MDLRAILWLLLPDSLDSLLFFFFFREKAAGAEQQRLCLARLWHSVCRCPCGAWGAPGCPGTQAWSPQGTLHCPARGLLLLLGQCLL